MKTVELRFAPFGATEKFARQPRGECAPRLPPAVSAANRFCSIAILQFEVPHEDPSTWDINLVPALTRSLVLPTDPRPPVEVVSAEALFDQAEAGAGAAIEAIDQQTQLGAEKILLLEGGTIGAPSPACPSAR